MSILSKYIGDTDVTDIIVRFRVRQLRVAVIVFFLRDRQFVMVLYANLFFR